MSDGHEYYGYKAPTPPPAPVQEEATYTPEPSSDFGQGSSPDSEKRPRGSKRAPKVREPKEKPERKTRAEKKAEALEAKKAARRLAKGGTPEVELSVQPDDFVASSERPSSNHSYDGIDSLPEGYGEVREIDYENATAVAAVTSAQEGALAEYGDSYHAESPKRARGKAKKPARPAKPKLKPSEKKALKKSPTKKGKKGLPDDAGSAMGGDKLSKKQQKDAKRIDTVEAAKSFRQLALMMSVSRDEIGPIRRIAEQYKGSPIGTVFAKVSTDMADNNVSFSAAFDKHGRVFPQVVVSLVSVGARAGKESEALIKAAEIIQDNAKTSSQVKSAVSEPIFTLVLTVLFLFVVLFGIIPQFKTVFDTLGKPLPLLSQILINTSIVVGWGTGITAVALTAWIIYWKKKGQYNEDLRVKIDTFKLNMKPKIFADLLRVSQMSQIFGNLHTLREINMSERDTLITTARSTTNWALRRHLLQHVDLMDKGEARFKELGNNKKLFPVDAAYTLVVGEDAGQGTQTLGMMAETYKTEAELSAQQLVVAIGPIANGAVGVVYMLVMLASYLPVFEMYTSIGEVD